MCVAGLGALRTPNSCSLGRAAAGTAPTPLRPCGRTQGAHSPLVSRGPSTWTEHVVRARGSSTVAGPGLSSCPRHIGSWLFTCCSTGSPYLVIKDLVGWVRFIVYHSIFIYFYPNILGRPNNYIPASPMSTPAHIVPDLSIRASCGCRLIAARRGSGAGVGAAAGWAGQHGHQRTCPPGHAGSGGAGPPPPCPGSPCTLLISFPRGWVAARSPGLPDASVVG